MISSEDPDLILCTDSIDEAVDHIVQSHREAIAAKVERGENNDLTGRR